ncbi:hypothetical protein [Pedobacter sp. UBA5917]|jgi:hypothetical protein|uniref:hypothetical protein n=1 Tax=Pedobacter sp. UBA5917 TaxID=1947061 RepID=UPI0025EC705A|nr:hypothetical protein [Pedobacter sp. UBA5917]
MIKQIAKALSIIILICTYTFTTYGQKGPEWILPDIPFNETETAQLMEKGTSSIKGTASLKKQGKDNFGVKGSQILLFPVTPYFSAFLELQKKYNNRKKQATLGPVAFTYRLEGRYTDDIGSFEFNGLKPGKYYIVSWIAFAKQKTVAVQTGTSTTYNVYGNALASSAIYEDRYYDVFIENQIGGFVEIKEAGKTTVVTIN